MTSLRLLGLLAIVGGLLGVLHAPFHSAAYLATEEGAAGGALLPWGKPFRDAMPWAFDFTDTWGVYRTIGALEPFIAATMLAGIWIVHRSQARPEARVERSIFYALFGLQTIFAIATAVEYFTPYRDAAFMVGFPALLLSILAFIAYGIITLRAKRLPARIGWLLIGGAALFIPMAAMFGHIAMALLFLNVVLIQLGLLGLRAPAPRRAGAP